MRLVPASGRSAPCVQHQTRNGDPDADLGAAPDRQKSVQFSVAVDSMSILTSPAIGCHVPSTPHQPFRKRPIVRSDCVKQVLQMGTKHGSLFACKFTEGKLCQPTPCKIPPLNKVRAACSCHETNSQFLYH